MCHDHLENHELDKKEVCLICPNRTRNPFRDNKKIFVAFVPCVFQHDWKFYFVTFSLFWHSADFIRKSIFTLQHCPSLRSFMMKLIFWLYHYWSPQLLWDFTIFLLRIKKSTHSNIMELIEKLLMIVIILKVSELPTSIKYRYYAACCIIIAHCHCKMDYLALRVAANFLC